MAREITALSLTGQTLYALIFDPSQGKYWRTDTHVWETYSQANWSHYATALTELASGDYYADFPSQIGAGSYNVRIYQQAGGSPASSDLLQVGYGFDWDGTAEVTLPSLPTSVWATVLNGPFTATNLMRAIAAGLAGKLRGAGTPTVVIRDLNDEKDRITATVDSVGNRIHMTLDLD